MSRRPEKYNTKQGEAVLAYLAARRGAHVTATQIVEHFQSDGEAVGRTTIYRQLERLIREGKARKHAFEGISSACYQFVEKPQSEQDFYHLKCESCGGIFPLHCDAVDHVSKHIYETHAFQVNDSKTVFYGTCELCRQG